MKRAINLRFKSYMATTNLIAYGIGKSSLLLHYTFTFPGRILLDLLRTPVPAVPVVWRHITVLALHDGAMIRFPACLHWRSPFAIATIIGHVVNGRAGGELKPGGPDSGLDSDQGLHAPHGHLGLLAHVVASD